MPNLIAYDICGVQPMTGPTGLIFAMRARHLSMDGEEALVDETTGATTPSLVTSRTRTLPVQSVVETLVRVKATLPFLTTARLLALTHSQLV